MDKQQLEEREARIIDLAVTFCNEHLDEECALLCTKMAQKLGAKQDSPFQSGRVEVWAAGVVYTICSINLLFSKKVENILQGHQRLFQGKRRHHFSKDESDQGVAEDKPCI